MPSAPRGSHWQKRWRRSHGASNLANGAAHIDAPGWFRPKLVQLSTPHDNRRACARAPARRSPSPSISASITPRNPRSRAVNISIAEFGTKGVIDGSSLCRRYFPTGHWLSSNVTTRERNQATGTQSQKLQNLGIPILPRVLELESLDDCPPELPEQPPLNPPQP